MQQVARITDALPDLGIENPFSPLTLLPRHFEAFIVQHSDFAPAYQAGFEYFSEGDEGSQVSTYQDVRTFLRSDICRRYNFNEVYAGVSPLPFRAGFCLGWLFALARTDRALAGYGLEYLSSLVASQFREETRRGFNPLVAIPGLYKSLREHNYA